MPSKAVAKNAQAQAMRRAKQTTLEVDGEPVAFMITLPDLNEALKPMNGSLYPFGWAKLLWWLHAPKVKTARWPLMGVVNRLQASRFASQIAFMMIEYIRRAAVANYGASRCAAPGKAISHRWRPVRSGRRRHWGWRHR